MNMGVTFTRIVWWEDAVNIDALGEVVDKPLGKRYTDDDIVKYRAQGIQAKQVPMKERHEL